MFRTQLHSSWLALNLALLIGTFAALAVGAFWIVSDSDSERARQAQNIQGIARQALQLSKGNPNQLNGLLAALPASPMFTGLEIRGKSGRLLAIHYDTPVTAWLNALAIVVPAPLDRGLDAKNTLVLRLFPAPSFTVQRLAALAPGALVTAAFAFIVVNLTAWMFRKRLSLGRIDETRWNKALAAKTPQNGSFSQTGVASDEMLDCLPDAIMRCDVQGRLMYLNATARTLLKLQGNDGTKPASVLDLIAPWDKARCAELLAKPYPPGSREYLETQVVGTPNGILPVTVSFMPAPAGNGELVLAVHDASLSRVLKEMLRLRDLLLDAVPQGMAVLSPLDKGELLYANPAFRTLLQLGDVPAHNGSWFKLISTRISYPLAEQIQSAISQMSEACMEIPWHAADGGARMLELRLFPANSDEPRLICVIRDRSDEADYHRQMEQELWERRKILDEMPLGLCIADDKAIIRTVNAFFAKLMAKEPQQIIGSSIKDWMPQQLITKGALYQGDHALQSEPKGRVARLNTLPLVSPEGDREYAYFFEDITAFKQQALANGAELDRLQQTLDGMADGIITTNENGFIQYLNPSAQKLTGLAEPQYKGMPFDQVIHLVDEKKREPLVDPATRAMRIGKIVKFRQDVLFIKENKQTLAVEISATPVFDRKNALIGAVIVMKDVSEQRSLSQQMQMRASRDPLTGLINRRELLSLLEELQYEVEEQNRQHTLCYMDLDKFKVVNDSCGHNAGDELLRQVAHLMNESLRASDVLARLGGDEFCAVFRNTTVENSSIVAEKIREAIKRFRFTWNDMFFEISVSLGLFTLQPGLGVEETISAADQACYHAKEQGRDQVYVASSMERGTEKPVSTPWSERLSEALDHDYFRLFRLDAQAIQPGRPETPAYHDVLLQLHEPNRPPLVTSAFMPNAHRHNLTPSIERWAIDKLFTAIRASAPNDASQEVFAIHLSAVTVAESSFSGFILQQSKRHEVSPRRICFVITEDDLVQNFTVLQRFMLDGKEVGYRFCLSQFGGGISSFAYIRNLPLDFLIIDNSLTYRLDSDPVDAVIVRAIQNIGAHMHIRIIAQNVQNQVIREMLGTLGIDYVLGAGNAEPVPLETVTAG